MRLEGKRILITGGTGGIGEAAARLFYGEGARLFLSDLDEEKGKKLAELLPGTHFYSADVCDSGQMKDLFGQVKEKLGGLDGVLHTAGIVSSYDLLSCTEEHFEKVMEVHLKGTFLCLQQAAAMMLETGGSIVLTASQRGILGATGSLAYNAAKGGIVIMGKSAAMELGKYNIRVNVLCPGATETPMLRQDINNSPDPQMLEAKMLCAYPLGRFGTAEESAYGALYLLSDESSFTTGTTLVVDGGNTAG
ncbi:MAG: SDR family oxidoreductase [Hungatella sp.]|jgi:NAD(P)-dependent dehydrogenase (short-subunit alcohol dehydrogenase family)|nr:SDR family oxidoreductase [Hungatella sp.]